MQSLLLALLVLLVVAALAAWLVARRQLTAQGIPLRARVVYSDTGGWERVEAPLFSAQSRLTGKPDYILKEGDAYIPIEVKPNRTAPGPLPSDSLQLAAYGLLIEDKYGKRPPHGLLKYKDRLFEVEFTDELRGELLAVISEMREQAGAADVSRSHDEAARCQGCGYREECGQALGERPR